MKKNKFIYILITLFIISIISIYSFSKFINNYSTDLVLKQIIFYIIGIILILIIRKINLKTIIKYSFTIYIINTLLLLLLLIFGKEINGSKAWFTIPLLGAFQPSEFMKISLILFLSKILDKNKDKKDYIKIFKVFIIILIPSILTFLEPDTGAVIIYFIIGISLLYFANINNKWFISFIIIVIVILSSVIYIYNYNSSLFLKILGNNIFYRLERIFSFYKSSGYQLGNSLVSIGSAGFFGNGSNNILLYFPEGHTDFIFTSFFSIFGLFGSIFLIFILLYLDINIIDLSIKEKEYTLKYILISIVSTIIYQQIQNISMTIGLLPITGITLPFISYGGSSLISYCILLGIVDNIYNKRPNY